ELLETVESSAAAEDLAPAALVDEVLEEPGLADDLTRFEEDLTPVEEPVPLEDEEPPPGMLEEHFEEPALEEPGEAIFAEELPEVGLLEQERSYEERLEQTIRHVMEDLQEGGLIHRVKEVEDLMGSVAEVDGCSAALASREGLIVVGRLETAPEPELAAAYQIELYWSFARATEEGELGPLWSLVADGGASRLNIHPVLEDINLVVHESRPDRDEVDAASSLPGELVLREAILKKVMEDLGRLDGVQGNLVTSRDGLPIDYQVEDELNLEVLGVVLTQALVDSEPALERLGMTPVRQVLLRTEARWYSVIPLDREAVMITLLAPEVPRDLWQHKLIGAAQMLASVFQ
ncbi:MAG: roadblock/LC7 domain-containing protein, partial [Candidatus Eremiobacterota bacterium]